MKVVSLVPSWTETLIHCGVQVVGRTAFCIHPQDKVDQIPVVGGTKKVQWDKIRALKPDLVIFDREENKSEMAEECPYPWWSSHVTSRETLIEDLEELSLRLQNSKLSELSQRWKNLSQKTFSFSAQNPPAHIQWIKPLQQPPAKIVYVIWADPWMAAGPQTFIGSVFEMWGVSLWGSSEKYPRFAPQDFSPDTLFLCSTEPYDFARKTHMTDELPGAVSLVNGESFSWFGLRSLLFLEQIMSPDQGL